MGAFRELGIVRQQFAITFQLRAAAGGVVDDDVQVLALEHGDILPRQCLGLLAVAGVHVQRAATHLRTRRAHPTAVGPQNPRGGVMNVNEQPIHDAAGKEADGSRDRIAAGQVFRHTAGEGLRRQIGQHGLHVLESDRQNPEHPCNAQQLLQAAALVEAQEPEQPAQHVRTREQPAKHQPAQYSPAKGAGRPSLDLAAGAFHQVAKLHVRRAGRLAGTAVEAQVHVLDEVRRHAQASLVDRLDEVHASARGVHFRSQRAVGWAFVQTQPAVNARADFVLLRAIDLIETG